MTYAANLRGARAVRLIYPGCFVIPSSMILPLANALSFARVLLILATTFAVREIFYKIRGNGYALVVSDIMVFALCSWMLVALYYNTGAKALGGIGAVSAIEFVFAYLIGRTVFGTIETYYLFVSALRVVVSALCLWAMTDIISGVNIVFKIGQVLTGGTSAIEFTSYRFGLIRAQGAIEHPILMGTFFAICFVIFLHSTLSHIQKLIWCFVSLFGMGLALSSAPFLSCALSILLYLYYRAFDQKPWRFTLLMLVSLYSLFLIYFLADDPVRVMIDHLTLDPQTGLYRLQIWRWGLVNVRSAPFFGIGLADWIRGDEMSATIDSLWLVQTVRYGIPGSVLLALALLSTGITVAVGRLRPLGAEIEDARRGLAICIFLYAFAAFTVHIWGYNWIFLASLLGIRAGLTESQCRMRSYTSA